MFAYVLKMLVFAYVLSLLHEVLTVSLLLSTSSHALAQTHKWPVKPGVHVHVNGLHTLGTSNPVSGFTYGAASSSDSGSEKGSRKVQRPVASSSPLILSAKELKQEITSGRSVRKSKRNSRGSQTHLYPNSESLDADMSGKIYPLSPFK